MTTDHLKTGVEQPLEMSHISNIPQPVGSEQHNIYIREGRHSAHRALVTQ
jgi:hypothetical protein